MPSTRLGRPIGLLALALLALASLALASLALALSSTPALASESPAPTLFSPGTSAHSSAQLHVRYDLPEEALAGSLTLKFEGSYTSEVVLANAERSGGEHEFTLNAKSLLAGPAVSSATPEGPIPDGTYKVKLSYEGVAATAPNSATSEGVVIDSATAPPVLIAPARGAVIDEPFAVEYSLPEAASPGTVALQFARTGGEMSTVALSASAAGLHTVTFDPSDLATGGSVTSGPQALANGEYTLGISYQDALLNPAASSSTTFTIASAPAKSGQVAETPVRAPTATGKTAGATKSSLAQLLVIWKAIRPTRGHARALTATFPPFGGASTYTLVAKSGRVKRSVRCKVGGSATHRQVKCLLKLPSKGRWEATARAVGPAGTLADDSTDARIRH